MQKEGAGAYQDTSEEVEIESIGASVLGTGVIRLIAGGMTSFAAGRKSLWSWGRTKDRSQAAESGGSGCRPPQKPQRSFADLSYLRRRIRSPHSRVKSCH